VEAADLSSLSPHHSMLKYYLRENNENTWKIFWVCKSVKCHSLITKFHVKQPPHIPPGCNWSYLSCLSGTFTRQSKWQVYKQRSTPCHASFTNINQDLSFQLQATLRSQLPATRHVNEELRASYGISYGMDTETSWWES